MEQNTHKTATLSLNDDNVENDMNFQTSKLSVSSTSGDQNAVAFSDTGVYRDRPFSASMRSTASTKSQVSLSPRTVTSETKASNLFCYRPSAIDKAVEDCKTNVIDMSKDGELQHYWLLTEIDHWDMERERLVLLTRESLLVVKYDFVAMKARSSKRVALNIISVVEIGDLFYPQYSVMPSREHGGIRIHWTVAQPTWIQRWNPLCDDLGFLTLTFHLLAYHDKEKETVTYDVADFSDSLVAAVKRVREEERKGELRIHRRPLIIESYASPASMIFNQSHLGFSMERGGVSF